MRTEQLQGLRMMKFEEIYQQNSGNSGDREFRGNSGDTIRIFRIQGTREFRGHNTHINSQPPDRCSSVADSPPSLFPPRPPRLIFPLSLDSRLRGNDGWGQGMTVGVVCAHPWRQEYRGHDPLFPYGKKVMSPLFFAASIPGNWGGWINALHTMAFFSSFPSVPSVFSVVQTPFFPHPCLGVSVVSPPIPPSWRRPCRSGPGLAPNRRRRSR